MTATRKRQNLGTLADDPYLVPFAGQLAERAERIVALEKQLVGRKGKLTDFASAHTYYGLHRLPKGEWVFREWAPNAEALTLVGTFSDWEERPEFALERINANGDWEITLPAKALHHHDLYRLRLRWPGGGGDRLPAYTRRVVQDEQTKIFNSQVWAPDKTYEWHHNSPKAPDGLLIYEAHVGMAQEEPAVGSYLQFVENILPRIAAAGYNTVQLMGIMEHPYYGSFGYHVSNFFAASSRFGTPEELKILVDAAHGMGLRVIMDLVHSHAVKNELEGLSRFDGSPYQYFHDGARGEHVAWDSRCFDYTKPQVLHFLLSNLRFWLDEFRFDGFRFDGVTSMLYLDHGLGAAFVNYDRYFDAGVDEDAYAYLGIANKLVHTLRKDATTIAEDVSGMPGLASPQKEGGCGFDYRLAMGVPDCWFKLVNDTPDEAWDVGYLWHELTNRRSDEATISYVESHDQALVGGKTLLFELADSAIYDSMHKGGTDPRIDRALALHKMARLSTLATSGQGYMNFIGNEFGHPEWVDFPREGNGWSYHHARRQWSLRDNPDLRFHYLADFDLAMLDLAVKQKLYRSPQPKLPFINTGDKVLAFGRGDTYFIFNFHPEKSFTDYPLPVPAGTYGLVLDTDEPRFGGHERLVPGQRIFSHHDADGIDRLRLYLPSRSALVLVKERQDRIR
jgi:1,4-alpha-glucan branching enzyme